MGLVTGPTQATQKNRLKLHWVGLVRVRPKYRPVRFGLCKKKNNRFSYIFGPKPTNPARCPPLSRLSVLFSYNFLLLKNTLLLTISASVFAFWWFSHAWIFISSRLNLDNNSHFRPQIQKTVLLEMLRTNFVSSHPNMYAKHKERSYIMTSTWMRKKKKKKEIARLEPLIRAQWCILC